MDGCGRFRAVAQVVRGPGFVAARSRKNHRMARCHRVFLLVAGTRATTDGDEARLGPRRARPERSAAGCGCGILGAFGCRLVVCSVHGMFSASCDVCWAVGALSGRHYK